MKTKKLRYEELQARAQMLAADMEELRDEMQDSFDNMPDSLKYNSTNGEKADARIEAVTDQITNLDEIVEFNWADAE